MSKSSTLKKKSVAWFFKWPCDIVKWRAVEILYLLFNILIIIFFDYLFILCTVYIYYKPLTH